MDGTPTRLENLIAARDGFTARLAEVATDCKPSYSIDGQSVNWVQYYRFLSEQIDKLDSQIAAAEPYEFVSNGDSDGV